MYFSAEEVQSAAESFLRDIHAALPEAEIVTIGGWTWDTPTDQRWVETQAEISGILEAATDEVGGIYIDPVTDLAPIDDSNASLMISDDDFHPTPEGHAYLGRDLAYEMVERGLPRGPEKWRPAGIPTSHHVDSTDAYFAGQR